MEDLFLFLSFLVRIVLLNLVLEVSGTPFGSGRVPGELVRLGPISLQNTRFRMGVSRKKKKKICRYKRIDRLLICVLEPNLP